MEKLVTHPIKTFTQQIMASFSPNCNLKNKKRIIKHDSRKRLREKGRIIIKNSWLFEEFHHPCEGTINTILTCKAIYVGRKSILKYPNEFDCEWKHTDKISIIPIRD